MGGESLIYLGGVLYPMSFSGQLEWLGAGSSGIKRQLCQRHVGHIVNPYDADFYRLARSWFSMCKSCFSVLYTGKAFARIYCHEFCQWLRDSEPPSQHRSIFGWDCLPQIGLKSKSWCQTVSSSNNSVKLRFAPAGIPVKTSPSFTLNARNMDYTYTIYTIKDLKVQIYCHQVISNVVSLDWSKLSKQH